MNRDNILLRIGSILDELRTECRTLYVQPTVQVIDLELVEANANYLREHVQILRKIIEKENASTSTESSTIHELVKPSSINELLVKAEENTPRTEYKEEPRIDNSVKATLKMEQSPVVIEEISENELDVLPSPEVDEPVLPEVKVVEVKPDPQPEPILSVEEKIKKEEEAWAEINKRFQSKVPSLNDTISSTKKDKVEINTALKTPIGDLKKAIGLNDKFAFIKGLFNNSVESFENAIKELNACTNYNEANRYIEQQLAPKYDWINKPELQEQFNEIVKLRFIE
ncbi:hypothetical protein NF867_02740 [Solitalea sp. MAHUQ-68]|uniref:Uncharacterized protein n=1 Tax=Solitalea agri TaxID=2953739 RepID=A0A9X2EZF3_9SPHI|nr:hypothetical protein [Solitalea agri]MCO4291777.1 hypothetical protein [Solitalea agri]